jgi:hypothetical protein
MGTSFDYRTSSKPEIVDELMSLHSARVRNTIRNIDGFPSTYAAYFIDLVAAAAARLEYWPVFSCAISAASL